VGEAGLRGAGHRQLHRPGAHARQAASVDARGGVPVRRARARGGARQVRRLRHVAVRQRRRVRLPGPAPARVRVPLRGRLPRHHLRAHDRRLLREPVPQPGHLPGPGGGPLQLRVPARIHWGPV